VDQPIYWSTLTATVALLAVVRWRARRPLLARRSAPLRRWEWAIATVSVAALVFHCGAMFFSAWINAVPGLRPPADSIRSFGAGSQAAYWIPALILFAAVRRTWWPGLILVATTLIGMGVTMFWSYGLTTHLSWLAAAVLTVTAVFAALVAAGPTPQLPAG
jgi:hypothetical protein